MKAFIAAILIFTVCGVAMAGEDMAEKRAVMKQCREENKATEQEFEDMHSGKTTPENASEALKCTMKCVMEKSGVMDPATGEFQADKMKAQFADKPDMAAAVDKCKGVKGANPCETAYMISGCMFKNRAQI